MNYGYKCESRQMCTNLHLVLRFWNQVLTCASVIFRLLARAARSALARYFCRWKRFSSSQIWTLEKEVRGFFRLGGVRFWYGCPIRRVTANGTRAAAGNRERERERDRWVEDFLQHQTLCMEIQGHTSQISALVDNNSLFRLCTPYVKYVRGNILWKMSLANEQGNSGK